MTNDPALYRQFAMEPIRPGGPRTPEQQEIENFLNRAPELRPLVKGFGGSRARFLLSLATLGTVSGAARAARTSAASQYAHRKVNPVFAERWQEALDHAIGLVEEKAFDLALGINGQQPDKTLIQFILRTRRPEVYGDRRQVVHSGNPGAVSEGVMEKVGSIQQTLEVLKVLQNAKALPAGDFIEGEFIVKEDSDA